jgi:hypothetical protein
MGALDRLWFVREEIKKLMEKKNDQQRKWNKKRSLDFQEKIIRLMHEEKDVVNSLKFV